MTGEVTAADVLASMEEAGLTLATAESLTGGRLAAHVTAVPGASRVFVGGVVAYTPATKQALLEVPHALVEEHGVVSAACARAMAEGVRRRTGASYAVSTTGVAGPDLSEGKPVGTVFVGIDGPGGATAHAFVLSGDRPTIQEDTCVAALAALRDRLAADLPVEETSTG